MRSVLLTKIRIDGGTQPREAIDQRTVDEYAESYASFTKMPPLVVYFDGVDAWLADGFHRYHAAKKAGTQAVDVDWREGTLEAAKFYAAGANIGHGLRRCDADKERAIHMLLETSQGRKWAGQKGDGGLKKIAAHCGVVLEFAVRELGKQGANAKTRQRVTGGQFARADIISSGKSIGKRGGTGAEYLKARLSRDGRADLVEKVEAGEISARRAGIEAGIVKPPNPVKQIHKAIAKQCGAHVAQGYHDTLGYQEAQEAQEAQVVPAKPERTYSSKTAADTAGILVNTMRIARGAFCDADWRLLLEQIDKVVSVREGGAKEAL